MMDITSPFQFQRAEFSRRVIRSWGHGLLLSSPGLVVKEASENIQEVLGVSAEGILGSSLLECLCPASLEMLRSSLKRVLKEPSLSPLPLECVPKTGSCLEALLTVGREGLIYLDLAPRKELSSLALWPLKAEMECRQLEGLGPSEVWSSLHKALLKVTKLEWLGFFPKATEGPEYWPSGLPTRLSEALRASLQEWKGQAGEWHSDLAQEELPGSPVGAEPSRALRRLLKNTGLRSFFVFPICRGRKCYALAFGASSESCQIDLEGLYLCLRLFERASQRCARALKEERTEESLLQVTELISSAVGRSESLGELLTSTLKMMCQAGNWPLGQAYVRDPKTKTLGPPELSYVATDRGPEYSSFLKESTKLDFRGRGSLVAEVFREQRPLWFSSLAQEPAGRRAVLTDGETLGLLALPILLGHEVQVVLEFLVESRLTGDVRFLKTLGALSSQLSRVLEKIRAEEQKEEARAFLALVNRNNPDLVFVKDSEFRIVQANPAFLEAYPEEMRDKVIGYTTVEEYCEEEAEAFLAKDREAFETGSSETLERITFPDGKTRLLSTKKIRFQNSRKELFILGIARDVTEREQLIEKLTLSNEELERFAFVCSHDLQEPLRMIRSFSEHLEAHLGDRLRRDEKGKKYLRFVTEGATRAQTLISDILTYSRIGMGVEFIEEVDLEELMDVIRIGLQSNLEERGGCISYEPLPRVYGNRTQLFQLFQNLVGNGVKYQEPDSSPLVHVGVEDAGAHWEFSVRDNGIGIRERHLTKIFEILQRLHRNQKYPGTGIGLAICKKVVERHQGRIWVESTFGEGSVFRFTILKRESVGVDG